MLHQSLNQQTQGNFLKICLLLLLLPGCAAKMSVVPHIEIRDKVDFQVQGHIFYEGKKDYLPRTLSKSIGTQSEFTFRYKYDVVYGRDTTPQLLPLFNPLTLIGFPIGENTIMITGKLEILKKDEVVKTFTATCGFEKTRSIFSEGETFSELRYKGLIVVRNNIETQMHQEKTFFSQSTAFFRKSRKITGDQ